MFSVQIQSCTQADSPRNLVLKAKNGSIITYFGSNGIICQKIRCQIVRKGTQSVIDYPIINIRMRFLVIK